MTDKVEQAAQRLRSAYETRSPVPAVRDLIDLTDVVGAYRVQEINVLREVEGRRRLSGRKIGLTSPAVRKQFGVFEPDFGVLFADCEYGHNEEVPSARLFQM